MRPYTRFEMLLNLMGWWGRPPLARSFGACLVRFRSKNDPMMV